MKRRVVITGLGIVSPVGNDINTAWDNIVNGRSGIGTITRFDASPFTCHIAGEVKGFDISEYIPAKDARQMDTFIHYGIAAGIQAWKDAGLEVTADGVELGYTLARAWWGRGLATEAARLCVAAAFGPLELPRLLAVADVDNPASARVLTRLGFVEDAEVIAYGRAHRRFVLER